MVAAITRSGASDGGPELSGRGAAGARRSPAGVAMVLAGLLAHRGELRRWRGEHRPSTARGGARPRADGRAGRKRLAGPAHPAGSSSAQAGARLERPAQRRIADRRGAGPSCRTRWTEAAGDARGSGADDRRRPDRDARRPPRPDEVLEEIERSANGRRRTVGAHDPRTALDVATSPPAADVPGPGRPHRYGLRAPLPARRPPPSRRARARTRSSSLIHGGSWGPALTMVVMRGLARDLARTGLRRVEHRIPRVGQKSQGGGWPADLPRTSPPRSTTCTPLRRRSTSTSVTILGHSAGASPSPSGRPGAGRPQHGARARGRGSRPACAAVSVAGVNDLAADTTARRPRGVDMLAHGGDCDELPGAATRSPTRSRWCRWRSRSCSSRHPRRDGGRCVAAATTPGRASRSGWRRVRAGRRSHRPGRSRHRATSIRRGAGWPAVTRWLSTSAGAASTRPAPRRGQASRGRGSDGAGETGPAAAIGLRGEQLRALRGRRCPPC